MRKKRSPETQEIALAPATLHESVPNIAFELALYAMRYTTESTRSILNAYLKELGA